MESTKTYKVRIEDLQENIKMIQTVYAVTLVLGFKELALSIYSISKRFLDEYLFDAYIMYHLLSLFLVAFIGFRFFWCLGNLTRYLSYHYRKSHTLFERTKGKKKRKNFLLNVNARTFRVKVILNIVILFSHALIFFSLTQILKLRADESFTQTLLYRFFYLYLGLLIFNSIWLYFLSLGKPELFPEKYWCRNNALTAFACISLLVLFNGFLWKDYGSSVWIHIGNVMVLSFFFLNSLRDILNTITGYVFGSNLTFPSNPEKMVEADIISFDFILKFFRKSLFKRY